MHVDSLKKTCFKYMYFSALDSIASCMLHNRIKMNLQNSNQHVFESFAKGQLWMKMAWFFHHMSTQPKQELHLQEEMCPLGRVLFDFKELFRNKTKYIYIYISSQRQNGSIFPNWNKKKNQKWGYTCFKRQCQPHVWYMIGLFWKERQLN